jgi:hypothetical protein
MTAISSLMLLMAEVEISPSILRPSSAKTTVLHLVTLTPIPSMAITESMSMPLVL